MHNITPQRANLLSKEKARAILAHLKKHGLAFCFLESTGGLVSREDCEEALAKKRNVLNKV